MIYWVEFFLGIFLSTTLQLIVKMLYARFLHQKVMEKEDAHHMEVMEELAQIRSYIAPKG